MGVGANACSELGVKRDYPLADVLHIGAARRLGAEVSDGWRPREIEFQKDIADARDILPARTGFLCCIDSAQTR